MFSRTLLPAEGPSEEVMVPIGLEMLAAGRDVLNVALEAGDVITGPEPQEKT